MDNIKKCTCDGCGKRGLVVALHDRGHEVLALCKSCAPKNFEAAARSAFFAIARNSSLALATSPAEIAARTFRTCDLRSLFTARLRSRLRRF